MRHAPEGAWAEEFGRRQEASQLAHQTGRDAVSSEQVGRLFGLCRLRLRLGEARVRELARLSLWDAWGGRQWQPRLAVCCCMPFEVGSACCWPGEQACRAALGPACSTCSDGHLGIL